MKLIVFTALLGVVLADVAHLQSDEKNAEILKQDFEAGLEGQYSFEFETSNGIRVREVGEPKAIGPDNVAESVQGEARWRSPEGEEIVLQYKADENGYQPQGSHLPTPPPIPEYILRSLEFIRSRPQPEEIIARTK